MKAKSSYFAFYKEKDYDGGSMEHVCMAEHKMQLDPSAQMMRGTYISKVLDGGEYGLIWDKVRIQVSDGDAAGLQMNIYATDDLMVEVGEQSITLSELVLSSSYTAEEKAQILAPWQKLSVERPHDVLLHHVAGRYLIFELKFIGQYETSPKVEGIRIYLPKESWIGYLPEVYQKQKESDFLDRYLSIFSSVYDDIAEEIESIGNYLDPEVTPPEFLEWLAGWIGISQTYLWEEPKLRKLLSKAIDIYAARGTKKSIEQIIELYTGEKPYIVEGQEIEHYKHEPKVYQKLQEAYIQNPLSVSILINEDKVQGQNGYMQLYKVLEMVRPAHVEFHIIVLKKYMHLNQHMYLGINSGFEKIGELQLDGAGSIPFVALGGQRQKKKEGSE